MTTSTVAIATRPAKARASRHPFKRALRDPLTVLGLVLMLFTLAVAFFGPHFAPHAQDTYIGTPFAPPSAEALLGTDFAGQDIFSRVLLGGQTVVWMSLAAATLGLILGAAIGTLAAYFRGWFDELLMRTSDVMLSLPTIVFVLLFIAMFGRNLWLLVLIIGISHAPQVARVVRGATLEVSKREFVEYAQTLGSPPPLVMLTQVIPNVMGTLMVEYGLRIVWSIAALASLSVLGQGVAAPTADWGLMINENRGALTYQPLGVLAPLVMIAIFALAANLLAEGVARAFNVSGGDK